MKYNRGDIVIVPFPFDNLSESKPRPAIIVSNSIVNKSTAVILAAITTTIRADEYSFYLDDALVTNSLREACEVRCHKLFSADKGIITKKISQLKAEKYPELFKQIISLLS